MLRWVNWKKIPLGPWLGLEATQVETPPPLGGCFDLRPKRIMTCPDLDVLDLLLFVPVYLWFEKRSPGRCVWFEELAISKENLKMTNVLTIVKDFPLNQKIHEDPVAEVMKYRSDGFKCSRAYRVMELENCMIGQHPKCHPSPRGILYKVSLVRIVTHQMSLSFFWDLLIWPYISWSRIGIALKLDVWTR